MKKILLVSDGKNFPEGAFEFVKTINERESFLLTGVFFSSADYKLLSASALSSSAAAVLEFSDEREEEVIRSINKFEDGCRKNLMEYRVHRENDFRSMEDILLETRFSDLLVMSQEHFCTDADPVQPNSFMLNILRHAECPVLLIPENFSFPQTTILFYDGSKESMYAIKHYAYLMEAYTGIETRLVFFHSNPDAEIPGKDYMEEYAARHFSDLVIEHVHETDLSVPSQWIQTEHDALLVSGSFGRSAFSNILKHSFIENIIHQHSMPVFVAHYV